MKISYASILLAAALPAFAQVVIEPSAEVELDPSTGEEIGPSSGGNADPSVGPTGKCPPGTVYRGQSVGICFFMCENQVTDDETIRYSNFPMNKGVGCYTGSEYGKCDGQGICIPNDKTSSSQSPTPSSSTVPTSSSMSSGMPSPSGEPNQEPLPSPSPDECPPGMPYLGPSLGASCYVDCEDPSKDSMFRTTSVMRKDGVECFEANKYGTCDDGSCIIDLNDPRNMDPIAQAGWLS
jgi:hypothetical protein